MPLNMPMTKYRSTENIMIRAVKMVKVMVKVLRGER